MAAVMALALGLTGLFWKEFKLLSFDPEFARSLGFPRLELLLTSILAFAIVIGLQLVGVVLMAAMIIAPAAAARQWSRSLEQMVGLAALFGALAGVSGALVSASGRGLATGPLIVIAASLIVLVSLLVAPGRGLLWAALQARRTRTRLARQRVLLDLYGLAQQHKDPGYASEGGMLSALYGARVDAPLRALARTGMVEEVAHMPGKGPHWRLTPEGQRRAQEMLAGLGRD